MGAENDCSIDWADLRRRLVLHLAPRWGVIEDEIQDALMALFQATMDGVDVASLPALAVTIARRRSIDAARKERHLEPLPDGMATEVEAAMGDDQVGILRDVATAGLTGLQLLILGCILRGIRTTKGIARDLDRDPKTIKESRAGLQRWLGKLAGIEDCPPPPHLND